MLTPLDWVLVTGSVALSLGIGLYYARRGGRGTAEYFVSGRNLPWWLAGTSMVATTFAADTPLAVTGLVARDGVAGNWIWWNAAIGSMLTVFFFARLWRRAGVMTDVEFAELRYGGRPAAFLRGFRAVYFGLVLNCLIVGWVNLAMAKILLVTLGWDRMTAVMVMLAVTGLYASASGLWGVVVADAFQFTFAMAGSVVLAWYAISIPEVGGLDGLRMRLPADGVAFLPRLGDGDAATAFALPLASFVAFLGVQWWASWYPGQEPGGGGYVAQRMMSARDERHAVLATTWFVIAHYCLRPWPWILVGLVSVVVYPDLVDKEAGYVVVLRDHLPAGWRGLLIGAFAAAYMSTVGTQLNWGTSYLVHDAYRRFARPGKPERHYVTAARVTTLALMGLSGIVTFYLETIRQAWEFVLEAGAGVGLVLILRWYWWRLNAWSEIAAMVAPAAGFLALRTLTDLAFPYTLLVLTAWTSACWITVTFLTRPEGEDRLTAFYARVRPPGPGWRRVAARAGLPAPESLRPSIVGWCAGCVLVYALLFGAGSVLLRPAGHAWPFLVLGLGAGVVLFRYFARQGWHTVVK